MRFTRRTELEEPEINLIPLIDVLLVMLIFLTATTTFTRVSALAVQLPASASAEATPVSELAIEVDAQGQVAVAGRPLAGSTTSLDAALKLALTQFNETPLVVIYADAQAQHQAVIDVMQAARRVGLERLSFAARQPGN